MSEVQIETVNGERLCFKSFEESPSGCEYVRIVNSEGKEVAYWDHNEWRDDPVSVMGAIMGAIQSGVEGPFHGLSWDEKPLFP